MSNSESGKVSGGSPNRPSTQDSGRQSLREGVIKNDTGSGASQNQPTGSGKPTTRDKK